MTSESVRQAGAAPDLNHREPEYAALIREVRERLMQVYPNMGPEWRPYLLGGSGTAAVEAMVTSYVVQDPVLVLANGYYSGRITDILDAHRLPHRTMAFDWEAPIEVEAVERVLRRERFEAVLMTHHETTLGRLNPVATIAALCKELGVRCLVDAMSSFGADDLNFGQIDAIATSANKCLHGVPGVSFVLAQCPFPEGLPRRSYYLHLPMYEGESPPVTPPVPALLSLRQALRENPGGQPARRGAYAVKVGRLREGLTERGFTLAVPESHASLTLVAATMPAGWTFDAWCRANYERGYALYETKGHLRERFFQASVMGEVTLEDVEGWLGVVDELLRSGP